MKNSPARHVGQAISYVRDGGRYISPQVGRTSRAPAAPVPVPPGRISPRPPSRGEFLEEEEEDSDDSVEEPPRPRFSWPWLARSDKSPAFPRRPAADPNPARHLEARLPELVDGALTGRFRKLADQIQADVEEKRLAPSATSSGTFRTALPTASPPWRATAPFSRHPWTSSSGRRASRKRT